MTDTPTPKPTVTIDFHLHGEDGSQLHIGVVPDGVALSVTDGYSPESLVYFEGDEALAVAAALTAADDKVRRQRRG